MTDQETKYSPAKLKEFNTLINEKLSAAQEQIAIYKQTIKNKKEQAATVNAGFSEGSKHFQQQAKNQQMVRRLQRKSGELRAALSRIEDGNYGVCSRTGKLIREERLRAMPTATFDIPPRKK